AVYTFFSLMSLLPPRSTLFPYTTLFRSLRDDLLVVERDDRQVHPRRGSVGERLEVGDDEIRIVHRELRGQVGYDLVKVHDLAPVTPQRLQHAYLIPFDDLSQGRNRDHGLFLAGKDLSRRPATAEHDFVAAYTERVGNRHDTRRVAAALSTQCVDDPRHKYSVCRSSAASVRAWVSG